MNARGLASDNYAGTLPEMIEAIEQCNKEHARSYGYDTVTEEAIQEFKKIFGADINVSFVFNGTGANVLGISCVTQSHNGILCADSSHLYVDESTAPEVFTGCKYFALKTNSEGKIEPGTIRKAVTRRGDEHYPQINTCSITQPTEYGTVYTLEELLEIGKTLKELDLVFHMDGARLYNAALSLNCTFQQMTRDVGVDILSFGGTKIGLIFGEAIVFFNKNLSGNLKYKQKQSMQLPSKMRFISAQFLCLLKDELWKRSASHSNKMAQKLYNGIEDISQIKITKPVQTNVVFAIIPEEWNTTLITHTPFYVWREETNEVRWMCSFDTTDKDIDEFVEEIKKLAENNKT
jgi:threonine aldolase